MSRKKKVQVVIQVSSGALNAPANVPAEEPRINFETVRKDYEDLDPKIIQPVGIIPDYVEPTRVLDPIVVVAPSGCFCIEGWELIQKALDEQRATVRCHVAHVQEVSENELAIRKVAVRTVPEGGRASYAETVRNVDILFTRLSASTENPIIYSHGGARKGNNFSTNREENIRVLLAERTMKSITTISKYVNHAEHINGETMNLLVERRTEKDFFENIQVVKRNMLTKLQSDRVPENDITNQISEAVLRMCQDPQEIENVRNSLLVAPQESDNSEEIPEEERNEGEEPPELHHWSGNQENVTPPPSDGQEIRRRGVEIAERLKGYFENASSTLPEVKQSVRMEMQNLLRLLTEISSETETPLESEAV